MRGGKGTQKLSHTHICTHSQEESHTDRWTQQSRLWKSAERFMLASGFSCSFTPSHPLSLSLSLFGRPGCLAVNGGFESHSGDNKLESLHHPPTRTSLPMCMYGWHFELTANETAANGEGVCLSPLLSLSPGMAHVSGISFENLLHWHFGRIIRMCRKWLTKFLTGLSSV